MQTIRRLGKPFLRRQWFSRFSVGVSINASKIGKPESKSHRGWSTVARRQRFATPVLPRNRIARRKFCRNQSRQQNAQEKPSVAPSSNVRPAVSPGSIIQRRLPDSQVAKARANQQSVVTERIHPSNGVLVEQEILAKEHLSSAQSVRKALTQ